MRKYVSLLLFTLCFAIFGANEKEGLNLEIAPKINFFMSQKQLENSIQRKVIMETDNPDGMRYTLYTNVPDLVNYVHKEASVLFFEDQLMSSVFMTPTTMAEHKKILDSYIKFFNKTPKNVLTKVENKKANAILYYNKGMLLSVYYENNHTYVVIQLADDSIINYRMKAINSL